MTRASIEIVIKVFLLALIVVFILALIRVIGMFV